mmetsp:Transcript_4168/g.6142  ORF Transcript_4168/g.6142 Transcript_4168/m.6142 type:complete len:157 (-) Transcript_4168:77-547(-)
MVKVATLPRRKTKLNKKKRSPSDLAFRKKINDIKRNALETPGSYPKEVVVTHTLNIARAVKNMKSFRERTPRAVREVKRYVRNKFNVREVNFDPALNRYLWQNGKANPPRKVRLQVTRTSNTSEDSKFNTYSADVTVVVPPAGFKGLSTEVEPVKN